MEEHVSVESQESVLYFISTQIQARHEDQEQIENKISQFQRFKNAVSSPKMKAPQQMKVAKPKRKSAKKGARQINSISGFVRETLGGRRITDTQSLLDQFRGDQKKLDDFLSKVELDTAIPHLLSRKDKGLDSVLFTGPEWKEFLRNLRVKFPDLAKGNKKTLKVITKRLRYLKRSETDRATSQERNSVWSQASRQPSDDLSTEDLIWLYDLDEEQLHSDTSHYNHAEVEGSLSCLTLSQAVDDPSRPDGYDIMSLPISEDIVDRREIYDDEHSGAGSEGRTLSYPKGDGSRAFSLKTYDYSNDVIEDSEPEIKPLLKAEFGSLLILLEDKYESLDSAQLFGQKRRSWSAWDPSLVSATTSLDFASNLNASDKRPNVKNSVTLPIRSSLEPNGQGNGTIVRSLSPRCSHPGTAINTPSCLRVNSSPLTHKQCTESSPISENGESSFSATQESAGLDEEVFMMANALSHDNVVGLLLDQSKSESLQFSPLRKKQKRIQFGRLELAGPVELDPSRSSRVQLTVVPLKHHLSDQVIPDSEEDRADYSIIEITKEDEVGGFCKGPGNTLVLPVPPSPENEKLHRPWENRR